MLAKLSIGYCDLAGRFAILEVVDYDQAVALTRSERWMRLLDSTPPDRGDIGRLLTWFNVQAKRGEIDALPRHFYPAWLAVINEARRQADLAEASLIRTMRESQRTWQDIATELGDQVGSRQAVQQRWDRLRVKVEHHDHGT